MIQRPHITDFLRAGGLVLLVALSAHAQPTTTVGMTGTLEGVVLPGPELEAVPLTDRKTKVVLRVVRVYPHGTAFRYDLEYFGLEPGTHDLRPYLQRKDGAPVGELPPISVQVNPVLPPGQVQPNKLEIERGPRLGGYRFLVIGGIGLWLFGMVVLVGSFFFPRRKPIATREPRAVSLAERLRPLVEGAVAGTLSRPELANLERGLLAYWRKRLKLETLEPGAAVEELRKHPEAGPLLAQLEEWLHKPGPPASVPVGALLEPYRNLPPDALDLAGGAP
ncbi:MAG TPA: hypothetical protein VGE74_25825 [Gemmata sp.]